MTAHSKAYTNSTSTKGKQKTAESQMKERGSGLKTTFNEVMESVLGICKGNLHNSLCTLLA